MEQTSIDQLLVYAAMANRVDLIEERLARGASPHYVDEKRDSAIMQACYRGFPETARLLLAVGADVSRKGPEGKSALDYALRGENPAMLDMLREFGLLPTAPDGISLATRGAASLSEEPPADIWFSSNDERFSWISLSQEATEEEVLAPFEVNCVVECCGMNAYNFSPRFISHLAPHDDEKRCLIGHLERLTQQELHEPWRIRLQMVIERIRSLMAAP